MDIAGELEIQHDLESTFRRANGLRSELQALMVPIGSSCTGFLETRERREQLEEELNSEMARLGALVLDFHSVGGDVGFIGHRSPSPSEDCGEPAADTGEVNSPAPPTPPAEPRCNDGHETEPPLDFEALLAASTASDSLVPDPEIKSRYFTPDSTPPKKSASPRKSASPDSGDAASPEPRDHRQIAEVFPDVKEMLGAPPTTSDDYAELMDELSVLKRATQPHDLERWRLLPDEVQVCLASMIAARACHLQSEINPSLAGTIINDREARGIFGRLSHHMEKYRPGHANGMAREHSPRSHSWLADANRYHKKLEDLAYEYYGEKRQREETKQNPEKTLESVREFIASEPSPDELRRFVGDRLPASALSADDPRLVSLLEPFAGHLEGNEFTSIRSAIEDRQSNDRNRSPKPALPAQWPWRQKIRDSRMLIVGGDSRPEAERRIEDTFEPKNLDWVNVQDKKHIRVVESWCERIKQGNVDIIVLLTDFISHSVSNLVVNAVKDADEVDCVFVDRGYGVTQIRAGIENFVHLDRQPA